MSEKAKLMAEVMWLAMQLQEKTEYAVFVDFSGHVDKLRVEIRESAELFHNEIATSTFWGKQNSLVRLESMRDTLLEFIEAGEVDTGGMNYEIEEIYHYVF